MRSDRKIYSFFFVFARIGLKTPFLGSIMSHRFPEIASIISILTFFRFPVSYDDKELTLSWHKDNPVTVSNSIEIPSYTLANHNWSSDIENFTTGNFISNKNLIGFLLSSPPSHLGYLPPYFLLLLLKFHPRSHAFLPAIMETRWKMFAMKFDVAVDYTRKSATNVLDF